MSNEKIIEKIKKLFALADNAGSASNEAETAMRQANKLLDIHNITKADLGEKDMIFFSYLDHGHSPWVRQVCSSIADLYDCTVLYTSYKKEVTIFGSESNRTTAMIIIGDLVDKIKRECKGKGNAFRNGAAYALASTCFSIKKDRMADKEEVIPGTGLVPLDISERNKIAVRDFIDESIGETKKSKSRAKMSQAGYIYGKGLSPHARVNNTRKLEDK